MSWTETLLYRAAARLRCRLSTAPARYKLAVTSGFVVASIGMATMVMGQAGQAEDLFSAFGSFFSQQPAAMAPAVPQTSAVYRQSRRTPRRASYVETAMPRAHPRSHHASHDEEGEPMRLGRASMCVRQCDGFAFPVGEFHQGDLAAHEATCRSQCPGALTSLYVLPSGTSSLDEAVEARTGKAYSQKAAGFHYTTYLDQSCSCHPNSGNRAASLLHDFTLRRGDAIMTSTGVRVFHGDGHFPYRKVDFVRLAESRDVRKTAMSSFKDIERASLASNHPATAQDHPSPSAASLKALDRQASLIP